MARDEISTTARLAWLRGRVDKLLADRKLTTKWLYERIGMTKTGYRQMWERDTVKYMTLMEIAEALRVPMPELLDMQGAASTTAEPAAEYRVRRYLEDRVDELERRMAELERKK